MLENYAWYLGNAFDERKRMAVQQPVAKLKPNDFGFFDMHGNAMEWCIDRHDYYPYDGSDYKDEPTPSEQVGFDQRTLRGGGYYDLPAYLGSGNRYGYHPSNHLTATGFRIAQTLKFKN